MGRKIINKIVSVSVILYFAVTSVLTVSPPNLYAVVQKTIDEESKAHIEVIADQIQRGDKDLLPVHLHDKIKKAGMARYAAEQAKKVLRITGKLSSVQLPVSGIQEISVPGTRQPAPEIAASSLGAQDFKNFRRLMDIYPVLKKPAARWLHEPLQIVLGKAHGIILRKQLDDQVNWEEVLVEGEAEKHGFLEMIKKYLEKVPDEGAEGELKEEIFKKAEELQVILEEELIGDLKDFDRSTDEFARQLTNEIKEADIVVTIPFYNEIAHELPADYMRFFGQIRQMDKPIPGTHGQRIDVRKLIDQVNDALKHMLPEGKKALILSVGETKDKTAQDTLTAVKEHIGEKDSDQIKVRAFGKEPRFAGLAGKKWAMRLGMRLAGNLDANFVTIDGDMSIHEKWLADILQPIESGEYDYTSPNYVRYYGRDDIPIISHFVYPFFSAMYNRNVRMPNGGEFATSPELTKLLLADKEVWEKSIPFEAQFAAIALANGMEITDVWLGEKMHKRNPLRPESNRFDNYLDVAIKAMFDQLERHPEWWDKQARNIEIEAIGIHGPPLNVAERPASDIVIDPVYISDWIDNFKYSYDDKHRTYDSFKHRDIFPILEELVASSEEEFFLSAEEWAKIVFHFFKLYLRTKDGYWRDEIVSLLKPLLVARIASFSKEVQDLSFGESEKLLAEQTKAFAKEKADKFGYFPWWYKMQAKYGLPDFYKEHLERRYYSWRNEAVVMAKVPEEGLDMAVEAYINLETPWLLWRKEGPSRPRNYDEAVKIDTPKYRARTRQFFYRLYGGYGDWAENIHDGLRDYVKKIKNPHLFLRNLDQFIRIGSQRFALIRPDKYPVRTVYKFLNDSPEAFQRMIEFVQSEKMGPEEFWDRINQALDKTDKIVSIDDVDRYFETLDEILKSDDSWQGVSGASLGKRRRVDYGGEDTVTRGFETLDRIHSWKISRSIDNKINQRKKAGITAPLKILVLGIGRGRVAYDLLAEYSDAIELSSINLEEAEEILYYPEELVQAVGPEKLNLTEARKYISKILEKYENTDIRAGIGRFENEKFDLILFGGEVMTYNESYMFQLIGNLKAHLVKDGELFTDLGFVKMENQTFKEYFGKFSDEYDIYNFLTPLGDSFEENPTFLMLHLTNRKPDRVQIPLRRAKGRYYYDISKDLPEDINLTPITPPMMLEERLRPEQIKITKALHLDPTPGKLQEAVSSQIPVRLRVLTDSPSFQFLWDIVERSDLRAYAHYEIDGVWSGAEGRPDILLEGLRREEVGIEGDFILSGLFNAPIESGRINYSIRLENRHRQEVWVDLEGEGSIQIDIAGKSLGAEDQVKFNRILESPKKSSLFMADSLTLIRDFTEDQKDELLGILSVHPKNTRLIIYDTEDLIDDRLNEFRSLKNVEVVSDGALEAFERFGKDFKREIIVHLSKEGVDPRGEFLSNPEAMRKLKFFRSEKNQLGIPTLALYYSELDGKVKEDGLKVKDGYFKLVFDSILEALTQAYISSLVVAKAA